MKGISKALVIVLLLAGCQESSNKSKNESKYEFWPVSKFNMDTSALRNGDEVTLVYTSRGPDYNNDLKYYIHVVAVSVRTGDTVNILTTTDNGFTSEDNGKVYNFVNEQDPITKLAQMNYNDLKDVKNISDLNKVKNPSIDKVARDPKFDNIANNKFPTVIGSICTIKDISKKSDSITP